MRQQNDNMHVAEGQLDKLKKRITALDNAATPLITAVSDRSFWPQILEELNTRLPEADIWITELAATSGGKLLGAPEKRAGEIAPTPPPTVPPGPTAKAAAATEKSIDGIVSEECREPEWSIAVVAVSMDERRIGGEHRLHAIEIAEGAGFVKGERGAA